MNNWKETRKWQIYGKYIEEIRKIVTDKWKSKDPTLEKGAQGGRDTEKNLLQIHLLLKNEMSHSSLFQTRNSCKQELGRG